MRWTMHGTVTQPFCYRPPISASRPKIRTVNRTGWVRCRRGLALLAGLCLAGLAGCASAAQPSGHARSGLSAGLSYGTAAQRRALGARYLAIAKVGNHYLDIAFGRFNGRDRHHLAAAEADLRAAAATERLFDQRLLAMPLPPGIEAVARELVAVNENRIALTLAASRSRSLRQLDALRPRLEAVNGPVEEGSAVIRAQLGLPPPPTD